VGLNTTTSAFTLWRWTESQLFASANRCNLQNICFTSAELPPISKFSNSTLQSSLYRTDTYTNVDWKMRQGPSNNGSFQTTLPPSPQLHLFACSYTRFLYTYTPICHKAFNDSLMISVWRRAIGAGAFIKRRLLFALLGVYSLQWLQCYRKIGFKVALSNPNGLLSQKLCRYLDQGHT